MVSILIDETMLLRSYRPEDAAELFRVTQGSREHLRRWLDWIDRTTRVEHSLQFIQQSLQELHQQQSLALGIFLGPQLIGGIGMHHWDHALKRAQIGYWISGEFEGRGIITRCSVRFLDFLFEKLALNKVELHFAVSNRRSAAVAERIGAKTEGIIRGACLVGGLPSDLVISGIMRAEWQSRISSRVLK